MDCDLDTSIPDWMIEHPETTAVFAELGLEIGCGGKSLAYVCHRHDLSPSAVLKRLQTEIAKSIAGNCSLPRNGECSSLSDSLE